MIMYGSTVWYRNLVKINKKLIQIQRTPVIGITKTYRTVSNEALQVLAGCPSLDIKIAEEIEVLTRIKQVRREQEIGGLISFDYELKIKPWQLIRIRWEFFEEQENGHLIFTDGSKIDDKVGCAFVHYYNKMELQFQQYKLDDANTVYMAEVTAIQRAIDYVIASGLVNVGIVTDSRSTLQILESVIDRRAIIVDIKTKLQTYRNNILLYWVKAHTEQWGNERADFLARSAIEKDLIDVEFFQSARQLRNASNQNIRENWQTRWSNSRKGIWTKTFYEKVDINRICGNFYFNQVLTGQGVFDSFQASMFSKPAECQCGQNIESVSHVILECELGRDLRSEWSKSWKNKDLRSADHEATGFTPVQMLFGRALRLPCYILFGRPSDMPSSPSEYLNNLEARLESVHAFAKERIKLASERMKTHYDSGATDHHFKDGD
ncbi:hypothetical protein AVEN_259569-1 [Araneus ventricosus]|uniref:ribonuclease H n=1 Tax=Araneus ventricosus TaxID=182803 RepID=A0A4Y2EN36_ARAVE|nr:hypothetical protein AVEN_259569-1 [Araneus ventricosus]